MSDFEPQVRDYLEGLAALRSRGASEDTIRDAFLRFLRGAFPQLDSAEPILLERHIPALRVRGGFADALYGDLIFEFKKRLDDGTRDEGKEELSRYIRNQDHPQRYFGILTDGETLEVHTLPGEELLKTDQLRLVAASAADAKVWLDCYLFHEKHLVPTADDVALRFGERSPTFWHSLRVLQGLWTRLGAEPAAQTKFGQWQALLSIVYGSAVGDENLFLRHTYLALFARVLAFVTLDRRAPSGDELPGMVLGSTFERMGLENFVGDDFFTWATEPAAFQDIQSVLYALSTRLTAAYDLGAVHEDLLKELYQELVDPQTRHDLGEFYTPDWLAEMTLRKAGFPPPRVAPGAAASLLDPSCGSGTFLFTAVRLLRDAGLRRRALVDFCAEHLAGLDVHPLAVIIAKTNLLLALGEDLRRSGGRFSLPIYMSDTLSSVDHSTTHPEIRVHLDVDQIASRCGKAKPRGLPTAFGLTAELAERSDVLHAVIDALLEFADPNLEAGAARQGFQNRLQEIGIPSSHWHQWDANLDLMRWLFQPPTTDIVWRFVLKNAYQPELLARRKFAFVVGNPPWLSYRYVRRRDYQERIRRLVFQYGLLKGRSAHLFTQMELATLFFAFCAGHYLAEGGTLAFVMPRSVLTGAKQHVLFQERYVEDARLLIDCERVTPLFNVPACVIVWPSTDRDRLATRAHPRSVPVLRLQAQLPSRNASLAEAEGRWSVSEESFTPLVAGAGSPYFSQVINGACISPRCAWFVRPPDIARIVDQERPQLETDTTTERQAKVPWKGIRLSGSVEAEFLYATLLSDHMFPFGWRQFSLIVMPIRYGEATGPTFLDVNAAFRLGKAGLEDWIRKAERIWTEHRRSEATLLEWLNWQGKLTRQRPTGTVSVLYGKSGTHICGCVVDASDVSDWIVDRLPVRGFIADYVTYWIECRNLDEAHYLCAVLNAPTVDAAIKGYQTKGAFGAQRGKGERDIHRRPFEVLPIPLFTRREQRHRALAGLSRRCHKKVAALLAEADQRWQTAPIGRLRSELRSELLRDDLAAIDEIVADIFKEGGRRKA